MIKLLTIILAFFSASSSPECDCKETYAPTLYPTLSPTLAPTIKEKCYLPIDMVIILDSSGSIGTNPYKDAKNFVVNFIDNFDISENFTHVGLIEFSTSARRILDLEYRQNEIQKGIQKLRTKTGGWTRTHLAFKMYNNIFIKQLRNDTRKVIVLLTDGNPKFSKKSSDYMISLVYHQVGILYNQLPNATIIPIAVGNGINEDFLKKISNNGTIFKTQSYDKLYQIIKNLTEISCQEEIVSHIFEY